jgi:hypothetical protein
MSSRIGPRESQHTRTYNDHDSETRLATLTDVTRWQPCRRTSSHCSLVRTRWATLARHARSEPLESERRRFWRSHGVRRSSVERGRNSSARILSAERRRGEHGPAICLLRRSDAKFVQPQQQVCRILVDAIGARTFQLLQAVAACRGQGDRTSSAKGGTQLWRACVRRRSSGGACHPPGRLDHWPILIMRLL